MTHFGRRPYAGRQSVLGWYWDRSLHIVLAYWHHIRVWARPVAGDLPAELGRSDGTPAAVPGDSLDGWGRPAPSCSSCGLVERAAGVVRPPLPQFTGLLAALVVFPLSHLSRITMV